MRKALVLLIGLLFAISAFAADVDQKPVWVIAPNSTSSYAIYKFVVTDSNTIAVEDTSIGVPMLPWGGDGGYPDAVALYGVFTEVGANSAACGDCLQVNIDVNAKNAATAADTWAPISGTNGSLTYASRTGKADTLRGITEAASGVAVYAFTAAELANPMPYIRIRWKDGEGAATVATDSFTVDWYIIYQQNK